MSNSIGAGFRYMFYGVTGSSGYLIGVTTSGVAKGSVVELARLEGARSVPVGVAEPERVTVSGDDQPLVQFQFDAEGLPNGVIETAVFDESFNALCQGTSIETLGNSSVSVLQPAQLESPDMCMFFARRAKNWASGVRGVKAWETVIVPKAQVVPLFTTINQRAFDPYRWSYVASKTDTKPWGATFTELLNGTTQSPFFRVNSDNPPMAAVGQGDGATDTFTLPHAPIVVSSVARLVVLVDGLVKQLTTHYTISGQSLVFVTPPGDGVYFHCYYEVDESTLD